MVIVSIKPTTFSTSSPLTLSKVVGGCGYCCHSISWYEKIVLNPSRSYTR